MASSCTTSTSTTATCASARAHRRRNTSAVAVATGNLTAQEAFIRGRIKLVGDQQRLIDAQPVFVALDAAFARVREDTTYA
jgi:hypothetical protein